MAANMNERGQIAIEYLLILVVMFAYLSIMVIPVSEISTDAARDTTHFARGKYLANQLAGAVDQVGAGEIGSKRTVEMFVPDDLTIGCMTNDSLYYLITTHGITEDITDNGNTICDANTTSCIGTTNTIYPMDCTNIPIGIRGGRNSVRVEKDVGGFVSIDLVG